MLAGETPEYFRYRFNGLRRGLSQEFVSLIRKAIDPTHKRFRDGVAML